MEENYEKIVHEINFLVGAMDGKPIQKIKQLIGLQQVNGWACNRVKSLLKHSDKEYALTKMKEVISKRDESMVKIFSTEKSKEGNNGLE